MDNVHSHPLSPSSATSTTAHTTRLRSSTSPNLSTQSHRYSEPPTGRQRKLLQNRNAKFPAKKLSLSNLSSRFSQLIHANDEQTTTSPTRNQENAPVEPFDKQNQNKRHSSPNSLGILDEITNSTLSRRLRKTSNIHIYEETPERPLLERSPFSSPAVYQDISSFGNSPLGFDYMQDTLSNMRLREISGNEHRGSPMNDSIKGTKKRRSIQIRAGFDTQEYIEHIEKELQEAKNEMFSPTTNKSLRDQLANARLENEKLRQEVAEMRDMYEAEVKRTIQYNAEMEVELKRTVRDLEEQLEQKNCLIRDLELRHEEKRLDNNIIDTLKAAIEKLEQDKMSLEDDNRSMTKRNEVLSELLAMSPTKSHSIDLRSPVREKRTAGRPMSMIIPKLPSSPTGRQLSQPASAVASPLSTCVPFFGFRSRAGSPKLEQKGLGLATLPNLDGSESAINTSGFGYFDSHSPGKISSRRSTLQSQMSFDGSVSIRSDTSSPHEVTSQRIVPKRKPRKFMSGSTQLKPLLLPTLAGDNMSHCSSSVLSSPQPDDVGDISLESIDPTTCFLSQPIDDCFNEDTLHSLEPICPEGLTDENGKDISSYTNLQDLLTQHVSVSMDELELNDETQQLNGHHEAGQGDDSSIEEGDIQAVTELEISSAPTLNPKILGTDGIDLNALNQLGLPEPDYDSFPSDHPDSDNTALTDIPRPLFSIHIPREQHMSSTQLNPQQFLQTQNQSLVPIHSLYQMHYCTTQMQASPNLKEQMSLHTSRCIDQSAERHTLLVTNNSIVTQSDSPVHKTTIVMDNRPKIRNPVEVLQARKLGSQPLAALTIQTIFGTISRYTSHIRDIKRDPLALARRVIANAWFSNWKRFGKLSWWVLGLFISTGFGGPKLRKWNWDDYNGEEIARRTCERSLSEARRSAVVEQTLPTTPRHVRFTETPTSNDAPNKSQQKPGWGKSMLLWGKFSMAIMLAVGGAVVKGPGEMLKDIDDRTNVDHSEDFHQHGTSHEHPSHCRSSKDGICAHSETHSAHKRKSRRYDEHPTPIASRSTSISGFVSNEENPSDITDVHDPYNAYPRQVLGAGEDVTVRAGPGLRTHIADVFERKDTSSINQFRKTPTYSAANNFRFPNTNPEPIENGTLQWPPSPGPIRSTNGPSSWFRRT